MIEPRSGSRSVAICYAPNYILPRSGYSKINFGFGVGEERKLDGGIRSKKPESSGSLQMPDLSVRTVHQ